MTQNATCKVKSMRGFALVQKVTLCHHWRDNVVCPFFRHGILKKTSFKIVLRIIESTETVTEALGRMCGKQTLSSLCHNFCHVLSVTQTKQWHLGRAKNFGLGISPTNISKRVHHVTKQVARNGSLMDWPPAGQPTDQKMVSSINAMCAAGLKSLKASGTTCFAGLENDRLAFILGMGGGLYRNKITDDVFMIVSPNWIWRVTCLSEPNISLALTC